MKYLIIAFGLLSIFSCSVSQVRMDSALILDANFLGDLVRNFKGGIQTGNSGLGLLHFGVRFDVEKAKMWKGGSIYLHAHKSTGKSPSENYIGDIQVVSNIDGYTKRFIYELWYSQSLGKLNILCGLHNLNDIFNVSENSLIFLNSSFGISPSLSLNSPISIYPVTTLGGFVRWDNNNFSVLNGWYNYGHEFASEEKFNIKNHLFKGGFFTLLEAQYRLKRNNANKAVLKLGATYRFCTEFHENDNRDCSTRNIYGYYFITDYTLFSSVSGKSMQMFFQAGYSMQNYSQSPLYFGLGLNYNGFLFPRKNDEIAFAFASARINRFNDQLLLFKYEKSESIVELTYKIQIYDRISLQPDLQYIINPAGIDGCSNAFVGLFRTEIGL